MKSSISHRFLEPRGGLYAFSRTTPNKWSGDRVCNVLRKSGSDNPHRRELAVFLQENR
jgi:hypothetical protein